jgi:alanine racemase
MISMEQGLTRAWVEIDLGALQRNALAVARRARAPLLPMVKADAYGLGAVAVARALEALDPWGFGVATVDEGAELRAAGIGGRVLLCTPTLDADVPAIRASAITPALFRDGAIRRWAASGGGPWHLAIDTGMSRAGVPWNAVRTLADAISACPPEGAFTHYHSADRDAQSVAVQTERFRAAIARLPQAPPVLHVENGPAIEHFAPSPWALVRPGVFLYGVGSGGAIAPEPVVHVRSRVVDLRTIESGETVGYYASYRAVGRRRVATISIGYADGIPRALGNRGHALVRGRRALIAGLVTMDMTMIDVTDIECEIGDTATLVGRDGDDLLTVADVATVVDMSPYELLTGLRSRIVRRYR